MNNHPRQYLAIVIGALTPLIASARNPSCHTILAGREAVSVLRQCSRHSPEHDRRSWKPGEADIASLELAYPDSVDGVKAPPLDGNCFQYAGFMQGGRRYIYLNAFPNDFPERHEFDWKHKAMTICDGGPRLFGMVYDVVTRRFSDLSFNGIA